MATCGIYKITNMVNGKVYIGQSVDIADRWRCHKKDYEKEDQVLYRAMRKYGFENFEFEILILCEEELLDLMEIYYIEKYNSYIHAENPNGYNMTTGGAKPRKIAYTKEARKNMSKNHADVFGEKNPMWGKHHSKEAKEKIGKKAKGRSHTKKTKEKMSKQRKGGLHINAKQCVCDDKIFDYVGDCAIYLNEKRAIVTNWLNGITPMPKKYYDRGLRYIDKQMSDYEISSKSFKNGVICNGIYFDSIIKCSKYFNRSDSYLRKMLKNPNKITQEFKELGLRYATQEENDFYKEIQQIKMLNK